MHTGRWIVLSSVSLVKPIRFWNIQPQIEALWYVSFFGLVKKGLELWASQVLQWQCFFGHLLILLCCMKLYGYVV